jgi:hypothetical protein
MRRPHAGEEASRLEASVARHERAQIAASEPKGDPALAAVSCDAADVSSPVTPEPPPSIVARVPTPRVAAALGRRTRQKAVGSSAEPRVDGDEARSHPGSSAQDIAPADSARVAAVEEPAPAGVTQVEEGPEPAAAEDVPPRPVVLNPPVPEDEASLVYRAKRLARTDHAAAWDLIEAHAKHFPDGALAPEREVLAIDLLGRMGREQEAKQRLARFMVRFPESGYRNIVTRSAADPQ